MENGKTVDEILLDELLNHGVLNESAHKKIKSLTILNESSGVERNIVIQGRTFLRLNFLAVWENIKDFPELIDVVNALGFTPFDFSENPDPKVQTASIRRYFVRVIDRFNEKVNLDAGEYQLPKWADRYKFYQRKAKRDASIALGDPTIDDIDGGRPNQSNRITRMADKINSQELLDGIFYADFTKIPKSRWGGWLRFWDRIKSSISRDKKLLGRTWGKVFILGYQVERNVFYEVWYNSIDSTFTIHDRSGIDVSVKSPTISEAIRNLVQAIAQYSENDGAFFNSGTNRALANSVTRALTSNIDQRAEELKRIDDRESKRRQDEADKAEKRKEKFKRDAKQLMRRTAEKANELRKEYEIGVQVAASDYADKVGKQAKNAWDQVKIDDYEDTPKPRGSFRDQSMNDDSRSNFDSDFSKITDEIRNAERQGRSHKSSDVGYGGASISSNYSQGADWASQKMRKKDTLDKARSAQDRRHEMEKQRAERRALSTKNKNRKAVKNITESDDFQAMQDLYEQFSEDDLQFIADEAFDEIDGIVDNSQHEQQIKNMRRDAQKSPYTQAALKQTFMGQVISTYDETRVGNHWGRFFQSQILRKWNPLNWFFNRRSGGKIELPKDKPSTFKRTMMSILGQRHRADFILGYSLSNRVDFEIWYVTEPNPEWSVFNQNVKTTIASYYVYDINSGKVLSRYIPYYRNAVQVVMAKIGTI